MSRISALKNKYSLLLLCILLLGFQACVVAQSTAAVPVISKDSTDDFFKVTANKQLLSTLAFKDVRYTSFQQQGPVLITLRCADPIDDVVVSPLVRQIKAKHLEKNVVQFTLNEPGYTVVKINNKHRLFLFGESPAQTNNASLVSIATYNVAGSGTTVNTAAIQAAINETAANNKTLYFPAGVYRSGSLFLPSNTKIVFAPGAVLQASNDLNDFIKEGQRTRGFINILNASSVFISGYGTIDGNGSWLREKYGDAARLRLLFFSNAKNVSINDIIQRDPGSWNTQIMYSGKISFNHVKLVNNADLANTDGFDPDASSEVRIAHCFAYCGDDNVAIKITQQNGLKDSVSDIVVKNCVFLTRKSSLKVGTESRGTVFRNILFENNDVILSDRGMALYCSDGATYDNIRYNNNRFEENYPDAKRMGIHFVINKRNADSKEGVMKNIVVQNCVFYIPFPKPSEITGLNAQHGIDVKIDQLKMGDKPVTSLQEANIRTSFSKVAIQ